MKAGLPHRALGAPARVAGIGPGILARGEEGAVLPRVDFGVGTQAERTRLDRVQRLERSEGVGRTARQGVQRGIGHEAGALWTSRRVRPAPGSRAGEGTVSRQIPPGAPLAGK